MVCKAVQHEHSPQFPAQRQWRAEEPKEAGQAVIVANTKFDDSLVQGTTHQDKQKERDKRREGGQGQEERKRTEKLQKEKPARRRGGGERERQGDHRDSCF